MNSIGIDLHKESISVCVMSPERQVLARKRMACKDQAGIMAFFQNWSPFQAVIEATSSYEWLFQLLEPLAQRVVLAHPKSYGLSPKAPARATSWTPRCWRSSWSWT